MNKAAAKPAFHYEVIAEAIRLIEDSPAEALSLERLSEKMGFSPAHFQRLFSDWVGVSPKRYHQYLALDHARRLLRERNTVLDTTMSAGLSSPGRLHDLFIRWEAMSPGVYASGGQGLDIAYGWFDCPFGEALVMAADRGICGMAFTAETGRGAAMADMRARWPKAEYREDPARIAPWAEAAFQGGETRLQIIGAPFHVKVWEALLMIPSGQVTTYSEIARHIGAPKAARAVGTAVGRNPVSWLIPCHRALRKSGGLGGYHWGLPVKRAMLAYEAARAEASDAA